ncbi:MAG TPA: hypothetical protein VJQ06_02065 [Rhizomicrobium sp.]|nr:hypothetical protein [Rhizomicrobium sp.]
MTRAISPQATITTAFKDAKAAGYRLRIKRFANGELEIEAFPSATPQEDDDALLAKLRREQHAKD